MDLLNQAGEILAGREAVKFEVELNDEDLIKIIVGVTIALSVTIAVGVFLAKKLK